MIGHIRPLSDMAEFAPYVLHSNSMSADVVMSEVPKTITENRILTIK